VWHCGRGNQLQFALLQLRADAANRAAPKAPKPTANACSSSNNNLQQKVATTIATTMPGGGDKITKLKMRNPIS